MNFGGGSSVGIVSSGQDDGDGISEGGRVDAGRGRFEGEAVVAQRFELDVQARTVNDSSENIPAVGKCPKLPRWDRDRVCSDLQRSRFSEVQYFIPLSSSSC